MIIKSSDSLSQFQLSPRLVKLNDGVIHITRHVSLYAGGWLAFCHLSFLPNELKRVGRSGFVTALVACFWRYGWWMMVRSFFWMFYKTSQSEYWIMTHDLMLFTFFFGVMNYYRICFFGGKFPGEHFSGQKSEEFLQRRERWNRPCGPKRWQLPRKNCPGRRWTFMIYDVCVLYKLYIHVIC